MSNDDDEKAPHRFPTVPRLQVGNITLLPAVTEAGQALPGQWIKPGGAVTTTAELEVIAAARGWNLTIINKE